MFTLNNRWKHRGNRTFPGMTSQRAMVAARVRAIYEEQAKERQQNHGGTAPGKGKTLVENLPQVNQDETGKARDLAGKAVGVSGKTVDFASRVLRNGTPEVIKAVDEDRLAVSTAARISTYSPVVQDELSSKAKGNRPRRSEEVGGMGAIVNQSGQHVQYGQSFSHILQRIKNPASGAGPAGWAMTEDTGNLFLLGRRPPPVLRQELLQGNPDHFRLAWLGFALLNVLDKRLPQI